MATQGAAFQILRLPRSIRWLAADAKDWHRSYGTSVLIDLWRYVRDGAIPEGMRLEPVSA